MKEKTNNELLLEVQELQRQLEIQARNPELAKVAGKLASLASFPQLNPNPVLEVDAAGTVTFCNAATKEALEKLGLAGEVYRFLPKDLREILAAVKEKTQVDFYREVEIKGSAYGENIYYNPLFKGLHIYASDITERKQAEAALVRVTEEWERTFNAVPDEVDPVFLDTVLGDNQ